MNAITPFLLAVKQKIGHQYRFIGVSFLFSYVLFLGFMTQVEEASFDYTLFYLLSIPSYYFWIFSLLMTLLMPLLLVGICRYLLVLIKVLFDTFLVIDLLLFKSYRFHLDGFFIDMAINDWQGMGLPDITLFAGMVLVVLIWWINYYLYQYLGNRVYNNSKLGKTYLLLLGIFLTNQMIHIWSYYYTNREITAYSQYFPYFFPTVSQTIMHSLHENFPHLVLKQERKLTESHNFTDSTGKHFTLNYPKIPLQCEPPKRKPNILLLVAESWRKDSLNPKTMPHLTQFSQQSTVYNQHFSGGNSTVSGLFSLLMGLHSSYWKYVNQDPLNNQSVLMRQLLKSHYDVNVYTSSDLERFSLRAMILGQKHFNAYDAFLTDNRHVNDSDMVQKLQQDLDHAESDQPWFKMVFLTSSHYAYDYPSQFKVFEPTIDEPLTFLYDKQTDPLPIVNDYRNSVHYVDYLMGTVFKRLQQNGALDNTIIVVTGDHGEEFNDRQSGHWGHGSNFTHTQIMVPMMIRWAGQQQGQEVNLRSSHVDIAPTLLNKALGCTNPTKNYSSGYILDQLPENHSLIFISYKDKAYLINDDIYVLGLGMRSYSLFDLNRKNESYNYEALKKLREQELEFLQ